MPDPSRPHLLIVDDEEPILETMEFTFEADYDVLTASSAEAGLALLDAHAPVAAVISDQRMPEMTGVEFLEEVVRRHPTTTRIILTGFADIDAIIQSINAGQVYAYITKPWEPDELKRVVRRAVELHQLTLENERLMAGLRETNAFLEAVMDHLGTGAVAVDAGGVVRAINRPARAFLGIDAEPRGRGLRSVLESAGGVAFADAVDKLCGDPEACFEEIDLPGDGRPRLRVTAQVLQEESGESPGRVVLLKEISHEPLRREFDELLSRLSSETGSLRPHLEETLQELRAVLDRVKRTALETPGMAEQGERVSRTLTALEHWAAVDDALAGESFPDAQLLRERMRIGMSRWPLPDQLPERVRSLARSVEAYYETGESPERSVL